LILAIVDGRWAGRHLFEFRALVALVVVSYAFYPWHLLVFFTIRYFDPHWNNAVRVMVSFFATLPLAVLSWLLIERPLMRWGKRLESRRLLRTPRLRRRCHREA
jgi:peptidoglycan/LPS O-acetylase OafA/YrhL